MADETNNPTWRQGLVASLKTQMATWIVAFLLGILTLFSGQITESVKFALNRADMRTKQYEELAVEVSDYIFAAELNAEFIENGWTSKETMKELVTKYNASIMSLRKKEFVYAAWVKKYWGSNQSAKYDAFMKAVLEYDKALHSLNDELERLEAGGKDTRINPERAKKALEQLKPAATRLRTDGRALLESLD